MEINISVGDYISHEEIKEEVKFAVRNIVQNKIKTEKDLTRVIGNYCYEAVFVEIEKAFNNDLKSHLESKMIELFNNIDDFKVFHKGYGEAKGNEAYEFRNRCIREQFPKIKEIVSQSIEEQTLLSIKENMLDNIYDSIQQLFKEA